MESEGFTVTVHGKGTYVAATNTELLLEEQKKYGTFVASISVLDKNFSVVGSSEKYTTSETSQLKNADTKFHAGTFIMGDVYERQTDDGLKRVVPAYIGVYEKK
mgnify:CR=1 FL=1